MLQAIQIMLMTVLIAVVVGFMISFMIWSLTIILNSGNKEKAVKDNEEFETAVAIAAAVATLAANPKQG